MSVKKNGVFRHSSSSAKTVEEYSLPQWSRNGELIKPAPRKAAVKKVEEVVDDEIKAPTVAELKAIREAAYNEGFEQGYANGLSQGEREGNRAGHAAGLEQGKAEGLSQGQSEGRAQALREDQQKTAEKLAVFDAAVQQLQQQLLLEQTELEGALLGLALRLSAQVVQDEMALTAGHIQPLVHAAVQSLPNPDDKLTLILNPQDVAMVESIADSHWTLTADASIARGGCKIKSGFSYVDYTLEHRFGSAVSSLLNQWQSHTGKQQTTVTKPLSDAPLLNEDSHRLEKHEPAAVPDADSETPPTAASAPATGDEHEPAAVPDADSEKPSTTASAPATGDAHEPAAVPDADSETPPTAASAPATGDEHEPAAVPDADSEKPSTTASAPATGDAHEPAALPTTTAASAIGEERELHNAEIATHAESTALASDVTPTVSDETNNAPDPTD